MMTRNEHEIRRMYREIIDYGGDFGDPIDTPSFNPWKKIRCNALTPFERKGICVAMLCYLMTAIDNSTYDNAVVSTDAREVRLVLRDELVEDLPLGVRALTAFLQSETAFLSALADIYRDWVIPDAAAQ